MVTTRPPKTIVKPTALGPVANTDTKLLIYGLFQKGRVLAQDGMPRLQSEDLDPGLGKDRHQEGLGRTWTRTPSCPRTQTNSRLARRAVSIVIDPWRARLVKKFVRHFDRVARPEYGLTRPCYTNYSGSTRLRVIADQYRNRPTILRLPKMNTASRRPDRPQNQNESSVPSRYRTRLSANAAKKSIELQ